MCSVIYDLPVFPHSPSYVRVYVDVGKIAVEDGAGRVHHSVGHRRTHSRTVTGQHSVKDSYTNGGEFNKRYLPQLKERGFLISITITPIDIPAN